MVAYTWNWTTKALEGGGGKEHIGVAIGGEGTVYKPNSNKQKILCNSVKTIIIREKIYIRIDILELSRTFHDILEDSRPF